MGKGGGGDNNQKKVEGISVGLNIKPEDISNKNTMSDYFLIGLAATVGALGLAHLAKPVKKWLFGLSDDETQASAALALQPNQLMDGVKAMAKDKPSSAVWGVKELYGNAPDEQKKQMKEWIAKQGG